MTNLEKNSDGDAGPTNKLSGWDALDEHISKLQEKYAKEKRGGDGGGHTKTTNMTATVQGTNGGLAAGDTIGKQAHSLEKKKAPLSYAWSASQSKGDSGGYIPVGAQWHPKWPRRGAATWVMEKNNLIPFASDNIINNTK